MYMGCFSSAACVMSQDAYSGSGVPPPASLPPKLMAAATRQWMFSNRRSPGWRPSRLQAAVAAVLAAGLGLEVQQEALTEDGLFSIDVAVEWKGRWVLLPAGGAFQATVFQQGVSAGGCYRKRVKRTKQM